MRFVAVVAAFWLASCGTLPPVFDGPDAPHFDPRLTVPPRADGKKRIGFALSGGGTRGFAHIGVLMVLEAEGIKPDVIVGSSVGSIIGALFTAGYSALEMEEIALRLSAADVVELGALFNRGMLSGSGIQSYVKARLDDKARPHLIEKLATADGKPRFGAMLTAQKDGSAVLINAGDVSAATRASAAIPGRILPVVIRGETYIDGDEASPLPMNAARTLGADIVIGINVSAFAADAPAGAPKVWIERDIARQKLADAQVRAGDIVIHPRTQYYTNFSIAYRKQLIAAGEATARAALPQIRAALQTK